MDDHSSRQAAYIDQEIEDARIEAVGNAYMQEVFRLEAKTLPFWLFVGGFALSFAGAYRLYTSPLAWWFLPAVIVGLLGGTAGLAVLINDHFERKRFLNKALHSPV